MRIVYRHSAFKRHTWGLVLLIGTSAVIGTFAGLAFICLDEGPQMHDLEHYRPISNTLLLDDQGRVFASFALQRRIIARYDDYPRVLYDAILSIEDKNFEAHSGFEVSRIATASYRDLLSRQNAQGASTLTMQLARNLFLSSERTYSRKIRELLLALRIERHFTKQQIFTLYANQIYLGHGVYGFATGAEFYFGKAVKDLTLEEAALLAALPKAPNTYSPIRNPEKALHRRNLVISSMLAGGKITAGQAAAAKQTPIRLHTEDEPNSIAPYFVEEVRQYLERQYGTEQVHESGLRVYTTLNIDLQKAANSAISDGLAAYERRHGWRVGVHQHNPSQFGNAVNPFTPPASAYTIEPKTYVHAVVVSVSGSTAELRFGSYRATIASKDVNWTNRPLSQLFAVGDAPYVKVISVGRDFTARVSLEGDSGIQGALLAIDNASGDIKAMVGGRNFSQSKFNRSTQALRQVGSSFKPYVYTAAIDRGATPEDFVVDSPATFMTASGAYSPHNYDEKFEGTITLRHALSESRNIPAIRLAQSVGIKMVIDYVRRFGIEEKIPPYLPVALGAAELTLLEHTSAFSVFPNDGLRATPRSILRVTDYDGRVLEQNYPSVHDVINEHTARVMTSMLRDVVLHGTAVAANRLKYPVGGKTGTTNNFSDAWFIGFSPSLTCGVWVGFDQKKSLGDKETGAKAALPIWMDFMATALPRQGKYRDFRPIPAEEHRVLTHKSVDLRPETTGNAVMANQPTETPLHHASQTNVDGAILRER